MVALSIIRKFYAQRLTLRESKRPELRRHSFNTCTRLLKSSVHNRHSGCSLISVADSARKLPPRTVGLVFGQDTLTVSDMRSKHAFQLAGLGFGFLPEPTARAALADGSLVEKKVSEPKPAETFYLAWRTGEDGTALKWWVDRIQKKAVLAKLMLSPGD